MDLAIAFALEHFKDLSFGRLAESVLLLFLIWRKVRPHLDRVEQRLAGLEKAVSAGFQSGEQRFTQIETRVKALEVHVIKKGGEIEIDCIV